LDEEGHAISFHSGRWKVSTGARILARGYKTDTLYMTANRDRVNETFGHGFLDDQNRKIIRIGKLLLMNRLCTRTCQVQTELKKVKH
jgi:hypothetical protein